MFFFSKPYDFQAVIVFDPYELCPELHMCEISHLGARFLGRVRDSHRCENYFALKSVPVGRALEFSGIFWNLFDFTVSFLRGRNTGPWRPESPPGSTPPPRRHSAPEYLDLALHFRPSNSAVLRDPGGDPWELIAHGACAARGRR